MDQQLTHRRSGIVGLYGEILIWSSNDELYRLPFDGPERPPELIADRVTEIRSHWQSPWLTYRRCGTELYLVHNGRSLANLPDPFAGASDAPSLLPDAVATFDRWTSSWIAITARGDVHHSTFTPAELLASHLPE